MKRTKFLSVILSFVILVASFAVPVSAIDNNNYYYTITDAEGNIVEYGLMSRQTYVNSYYTLPAGGSFNSYQYQPSIAFGTGFYYYNEDGTPIDSNHYIRLTITNAASIGGAEATVKSAVFSTNIEVAQNYSNFSNGSIFLYATDISESSPYYRAKITNTSSTSIKVKINVNMD